MGGLSSSGIRATAVGSTVRGARRCNSPRLQAPLDDGEAGDNGRTARRGWRRSQHYDGNRLCVTAPLKRCGINARERSIRGATIRNGWIRLVANFRLTGVSSWPSS